MIADPLSRGVVQVVFVVTWIGVGIVLAFRANAKGREYLRRLPPVDGVPLHMYYYVGWWRWNGPVPRAWRQRQSDPELERLRQEGRRHGRFVLLWMFGFPILVVGVDVLLILTGYAR